MYLGESENAEVFYVFCLQRQMSVVQIEHSETMLGGKPKTAGLSDPRLGTIDRKMKCETCTANMAECPGHFGHLELAKPMFHIGFMKTVLSVMRCVCFNCSKILVDEVLRSLKLSLQTSLRLCLIDFQEQPYLCCQTLNW